MKMRPSHTLFASHPAIRRTASVLALLALWPALGLAQQPPPASPVEILHGSAPHGEALFTGNTRLQNGGPACIACHSIAGLSFPNGGTLGPNLTHAYSKLGERGTEAAMQTLFFGVMTPIYINHPVVPSEQADLMAFLKQGGTKPQSHWNTQILILIAFLWGAVFVGFTAYFWRDRVRSVRRALVDRATGRDRAAGRGVGI